MKGASRFLLMAVLVFALFSCVTTSDEATAIQNSIAPVSESLMLQGDSGNLSVVIQKPAMKDGEDYPLVVVSHGFMGAKENPLIVNLSDKLQAEGFVVIRYDFNGHGESDGRFQDMTVLSEVEDAKVVIEYAESLPYVDAINLAGHSQGGVVSSLVAGELGDEINSIVLFAPAAVLEDDAKKGFIMGNTYDPADVPEYIEVFGHKLGRNYILEAQKIDIYKRAAAYNGKACIIHGTADIIVPFSYGERYHEMYQGSEFYLLEGEDHGFANDLDKAVDIGVEYLKNVNF